MLKNISYHNKLLVIALLFPIGVTFAANYYFNNFVKRRYIEIVSSTTLDYLASNNTEAFEQALQSESLGFQYINKGHLERQSSDELPKAYVVSISTKNNPNIIENTPAEDLPKLLPHIKWHSSKLYLVAVVATRLDSDDYYLVYSRLI